MTITSIQTICQVVQFDDFLDLSSDFIETIFFEQIRVDVVSIDIIKVLGSHSHYEVQLVVELSFIDVSDDHLG